MFLFFINIYLKIIFFCSFLSFSPEWGCKKGLLSLVSISSLRCFAFLFLLPTFHFLLLWVTSFLSCLLLIYLIILPWCLLRQLWYLKCIFINLDLHPMVYFCSFYLGNYSNKGKYLLGSSTPTLQTLVNAFSDPRNLSSSSEQKIKR